MSEEKNKNKAIEFIKKNVLIIVVVAVVSGLISLSANSIFGKIEQTNEISTTNEKDIIIIKEQLKNISDDGIRERALIIKQLEDISSDMGLTDSILRQHDREISEIKGRIPWEYSFSF